METKAISIHIKGRVQNVGFRYHTQKTARSFGIKGFVRNNPDGSVYAEAEGKQKALELFCEWCKKGPTWAQVDSVNTCHIPSQNYTDFNII